MKIGNFDFTGIDTNLPVETTQDYTNKTMYDSFEEFVNSVDFEIWEVTACFAETTRISVLLEKK